VSAAKDKIVRMGDAQIKDEERAKSFHLDTYCFDSGSENWLFWDLLREQRVKKIYFTGMLTHGQSDFFIQYIDPDSRTVRSYYPDFIFQREEPDGSLKYVIVEVKADNQIEDAVVQAKKDFAQQIAVASGMEYRILKSTDADKRIFARANSAFRLGAGSRAGCVFCSPAQQTLDAAEWRVRWGMVVCAAIPRAQP
jgi:type III restriction enzyme